MGITPVIDGRLTPNIRVGLVTVAVAGLLWRLRHQPPQDRHVQPPGSSGEHALQRRYGSQERARRFYGQQVLDRLNQPMIRFIGRQEMVWIATADAHGHCDCSFRAGPPGFVQVLDPQTVRYPEYRATESWPHSATWWRTPTSA